MLVTFFSCDGQRTDVFKEFEPHMNSENVGRFIVSNRDVRQVTSTGHYKENVRHYLSPLFTVGLQADPRLLFSRGENGRTSLTWTCYL